MKRIDTMTRNQAHSNLNLWELM
uniref:Uncharacterized protein n=1 Tax=Arundo donax TaxID=35708 RepID=A0A0A8Z4R2_ARUDO